MHRRIAAYIRVSTAHQIDKESIPAQQSMITKYCDAVYNTTDIDFYIDPGFSGKNTKRPAFTAMMEEVKKGKISLILVYKIDRISRNLLDFAQFVEDLKTAGTDFISLSEKFDTSTAMGQGMLKITMVFAEIERNLTRERVLSVSKDIVSRGGHLGNPTPYGYNYDKSTKIYTINREEAVVVQSIFFSCLNGTSTTKISNDLNDNGVKTKRGGFWTSTTVLHLLHNRAYKGEYTWGKAETGRKAPKPKENWITAKNIYPVIIDPMQWDEVQKVLLQRVKNRTPSTGLKHLFSGLLICGECGRVMRYRLDRSRKNGLKVSIYYCPAYANHWHCNNGTYVSDVTLAPFLLCFIKNCLILSDKIAYVKSSNDIEAIICDGLNCKLVNKKDLYNQFCGGLRESTTAEAEAARRKAIATDIETPAKINKLNTALEKLKDLYLYSDSNMTKDDYIKERSKILAKIDALNHSQQAAGAKLSPTLKINKTTYKIVLDGLYSMPAIDYKTLQAIASHALLCDFCHVTIKRIVIAGRDISEVETTNGARYIFKSK